jgi:MFS family permease
MSEVLEGWERSTFTAAGLTRDVYRRGSGPGVVVIHEIPGITPKVAQFMNEVVDAGFTVVAPSLVGTPGREVCNGYVMGSMLKVCVAMAFPTGAVARTARGMGFLRARARNLHDEVGGPGVGAVGMCFSGGFALGMMVAPLVIGTALGWGGSWRGVFVAEGVMSVLLALLLGFSPVSDIEGRENLRPRRLWDVIGFNPRLFVTILGASILYIGAEFTFNVWLAKYEIDVFGVDKSVAGLAVTLFWVGLLIGRLVVIPLTRKFHPALILTVGAAVWSVFALGVAVSVSSGMSMAMSFCAGLGASAGFPLILSFSARFPKWHGGVVFSSIIMAGALGGMAVRMVFSASVPPVEAPMAMILWVVFSKGRSAFPAPSSGLPFRACTRTEATALTLSASWRLISPTE